MQKSAATTGRYPNVCDKAPHGRTGITSYAEDLELLTFWWWEALRSATVECSLPDGYRAMNEREALKVMIES